MGLHAGDAHESANQTQVVLSSRTLPAVILGNPNPWPEFRFQIPNKPIVIDSTLTREDNEGMLSDATVPLLPYLAQDSYSRQRQLLEIPTILVENNLLRATIYPSLGGRMMSLYDKRHQRELLFDNPVLQFANLAIRNAWFSGGVEWNGPIFGHSLLTASPLYAGIVNTSRGPLVRLYEFDRAKDMTWQVDLFLPTDEDHLWIHVKAINPNDHDIPFYWWTNIAVPLTPATRVLSPVDYALSHNVNGNSRLEFPNFDGFDGSRPFDYPSAKSVFFRKLHNPKPWSVCVDEHGQGISHVSTPILSGRKFFTWGTNPGGKRWMDFLSEDGKGDYIEVQGGITPTQLQTRPIPARSSLEWTECISPFAMDAKAAQHHDYSIACAAAATVIDQHFSLEDIHQHHEFLTESALHPVHTLLHRGSGWGWLDETLKHRRISPGLTFEKIMSDEERPWMELLTTGTFSAETLSKNPCSFSVSSPWITVIQQSALTHGYTWLHHALLGVASMENGLWDEARQQANASLLLQPNALAHRNLALLDERENHLDAAQTHYNQAWPLCKNDVNLAIEIGHFLFTHKYFAAFNTFITQLPADIAEHERLVLMRARIALEQGNYSLVRELLRKDFSSIREGETSLSELWISSHVKEAEAHLGRELTNAEKDQLQKQFPVPRHMEFRMK